MITRKSVIFACAAVFAATLGATGASAGISFGSSVTQGAAPISTAATVTDVKFGHRGHRSFRGGFNRGFKGHRSFGRRSAGFGGAFNGYYGKHGARGHGGHGVKSHGHKKFVFPGLGLIIKK